MSEILPQIKTERFPMPLIVEALDGDNTWKVIGPFYCEDEELGRIETPLSELTDFGSIPRYLWGIISPFSRYRKPFMTHDTCYTYQMFNGKAITQKQADDCLLRGMKERDEQHNKICRWWEKKFGLERATIFVALRAAGFSAWNQHTRELELIKTELGLNNTTPG